MTPEIKRAMGEVDALLREMSEDAGYDVPATIKPKLDAERAAWAEAEALVCSVAETFVYEVERTERYLESRGKGGQQVPFHGPFVNVAPSARGELRRFAQAFRAALKGETL